MLDKCKLQYRLPVYGWCSVVRIWQHQFCIRYQSQWWPVLSALDLNGVRRTWSKKYLSGRKRLVVALWVTFLGLECATVCTRLRLDCAAREQTRSYVNRLSSVWTDSAVLEQTQQYMNRLSSTWTDSVVLKQTQQYVNTLSSTWTDSAIREQV